MHTIIPFGLSGKIGLSLLPKASVLGRGDWPWWKRDLRVVKKALKFKFNKHLECNTLGYMLAMKK